MGGKSRAAHTCHARLPDSLQDFIPGKRFGILQALPGRRLLIQAVIFHNYGVACTPGRREPLLDSFYGTGNRGVNRHGHKSCRLGDLLPRQHPVALFHQRTRRRADMLGQQIYQFLSRFYRLYRAVLGQLLIARGMNTSPETS